MRTSTPIRGRRACAAGMNAGHGAGPTFRPPRDQPVGTDPYGVSPYETSAAPFCGDRPLRGQSLRDERWWALGPAVLDRVAEPAGDLQETLEVEVDRRAGF